MSSPAQERINVSSLLRAAQAREQDNLINLVPLPTDSEDSSSTMSGGSLEADSLTTPLRSQVTSPTQGGSKSSYRGVKLNANNYTSWQYSMMTHLKGAKLWRFVIDRAAPEDDDRHRCLDHIVQSLDSDQLLLIVECFSPYEAWRTIEQEHRRGTAENILFTRQDFASRKWDGRSDMKDFLQDMKQIAMKLSAAGSKVSDHELCMSILMGIQHRDYRHVVGTLTIGRTTELKYSEVRTALLTAEQMYRRINPKPTEQHGFKAEHSGHSSKSGQSTRPAGSSGPSSGRRRKMNQSSKKRPVGDKKCFNCDRPGHFARDCRLPKREEANAATATTTNLSDESKEESFAFVATTSEDHHSAAIQHDATEEALYCRANNIMVCDSGATAHMTGERSLLYNERSIKPIIVTMGNGVRLPASVSGTIDLRGDDLNPIPLADVLFVPGLKDSLFSVGQFLDVKSQQIHFTKSTCRIIDSSSGGVVLTGRRRHQHYELPIIVVHSACVATATVEVWHNRLGHIAHRAIVHMANNQIAIGLELRRNSMTETRPCGACDAEKATHTPANRERTTAATQIGERIHSDISGPYSPSSYGNRYFISFIDEKSRYSWVDFMKNRSQALMSFKKFMSEFRMATKRPIQSLRSDNGGEYSSDAFIEFLIESGIHRETTVPHNPHQNGIAERYNRVVGEMMRTSMTYAKLPFTFWEESARTANLIRNYCTTRALPDGKTPHEALNGRKPDLSIIRTFGCRAWATIPVSLRSKDGHRAISCILVGYEPNKGGYRLVRLDNKRLLISRSVKFDETRPDNWVSSEHPPSSPIMGIVSSVDQREMPYIAELIHSSNTDTTRDQVPVREQVATSLSDAAIEMIDVQDEEPTISDSVALSTDEVAIDTPPDTRRRSERRRVAPLPFRTEFGYAATQQGLIEPSTYEQAISSNQSDKWNQAMQSEYDSLMANGTWVLVNIDQEARRRRSNGKPPIKLIGSRWIYKLKLDSTGQVDRYKARLVAQGFSQRPGVDFEETYAPVVDMTTLRALLSYATHHNWFIEVDDVETAYLNGRLEEEIYLRQPKGFEKGSSQACRLIKAIYGLKQAGRTWIALTKVLSKMGFVHSHADQCLMIRRTSKAVAMIGIYVDDLLLIGDKQATVDEARRQLHLEFKMKSLGPVSWLLGIKIERDRKARTITLTQQSYTESILKLFRMEDCHPVSTPGASNVILTARSAGDISEPDFPFRECIGKLLYLARMTRPDIMTAVCLVARFNNDPTTQHVTAIKRVLRYLAGTSGRGIVLGGQASPVLRLASDASYAEDLQDRKSTTGVVAIYGGIIDFFCRKQPTIALSTTEAEINAITEGVRSGIHLRSLISDIEGRPLAPTYFDEDNQAAIAIVLGRAGTKSRTKHYDVKVHFLQSHMTGDNCKFLLVYCATRNMIADFLTKNLPAPAFTTLTDRVMSGSVEVCAAVTGPERRPLRHDCAMDQVHDAIAVRAGGIAQKGARYHERETSFPPGPSGPHPRRAPAQTG